MTHEDVEPFLAAMRAKGRDEILDEIARSESDVETRSGSSSSRWRASALARCASRERTSGAGSRISADSPSHPAFRGAKVADTAARLFQRHLFDDLGFHRVQMEIYGFNERAMRHAERAGFTREGLRRKAYWRNGEWVDGVLFGLVAEDLAQ